MVGMQGGLLGGQVSPESWGTRLKEIGKESEGRDGVTLLPWALLLS